MQKLYSNIILSETVIDGFPSYDFVNFEICDFSSIIMSLNKDNSTEMYLSYQKNIISKHLKKLLKLKP